MVQAPSFLSAPPSIDVNPKPDAMSTVPSFSLTNSTSAFDAQTAGASIPQSSDALTAQLSQAFASVIATWIQILEQSLAMALSQVSVTSTQASESPMNGSSSAHPSSGDVATIPEIAPEPHIASAPGVAPPQLTMPQVAQPVVPTVQLPVPQTPPVYVPPMVPSTTQPPTTSTGTKDPAIRGTDQNQYPPHQNRPDDSGDEGGEDDDGTREVGDRNNDD